MSFCSTSLRKARPYCQQGRCCIHYITRYIRVSKRSKCLLLQIVLKKVLRLKIAAPRFKVQCVVIQEPPYSESPTPSYGVGKQRVLTSNTCFGIQPHNVFRQMHLAQNLLHCKTRFIGICSLHNLLLCKIKCAICTVWRIRIRIVQSKDSARYKTIHGT